MSKRLQHRSVTTEPLQGTIKPREIVIEDATGRLWTSPDGFQIEELTSGGGGGTTPVSNQVIGVNTTEYVIGPEDNGVLLVFVRRCTVVIPANVVFPAGFSCSLRQGLDDPDYVIVVPEPAITLNNYNDVNGTAGRYATVDLVNIAGGVWDISGAGATRAPHPEVPDTGYEPNKYAIMTAGKAGQLDISASQTPTTEFAFRTFIKMNQSTGGTPPPDPDPPPPSSDFLLVNALVSSGGDSDMAALGFEKNKPIKPKALYSSGSSGWEQFGGVSPIKPNAGDVPDVTEAPLPQYANEEAEGKANSGISFIHIDVESCWLGWPWDRPTAEKDVYCEVCTDTLEILRSAGDAILGAGVSRVMQYRSIPRLNNATASSDYQLYRTRCAEYAQMYRENRGDNRGADMSNAIGYTLSTTKQHWYNMVNGARIASTDICPNTPFTVYLWPQYHKAAGTSRTFLPRDFWREQLDWARANASGIILWGYSNTAYLPPGAPNPAPWSWYKEQNGWYDELASWVNDNF